MTVTTASPGLVAADTWAEAVASTDVSGSSNGWVRRVAQQRHQQAATPQILQVVANLAGTADEGVNAERGRRRGAALLLEL